MHIVAILRVLFGALILSGLSAQYAQAAWQWQSTTPAVAASNTNVTPLTVNYPSGCCAAGDILFFIARENGTGTLTWSNSPTQIELNNSNHTLQIHSTIATGSESGSVTVSSSGTTRVIATILRYTGGPATLTGIVHASQQVGGAAANGLSWPGLTISQDNTLVLAIGSKTCAWTNANTGFGTERVDSTSTSAGLVVEELVQTTAANLVTGSWAFGADCSAIRRTIAVSLEAGATESAWVDIPAVSSQTNSAYTVGFKTDISTTVYCEAVRKDASAPNEAQIIAGTDGASVAALATCNVAVTGGVANSCTLSGLTFPVHDLYCVASP